MSEENAASGEPAAADPQPERVRASHDGRAAPAAAPQFIGRGIVVLLLATFGWQLTVRAFGLDASLRPSAVIESTGQMLHPYAYAFWQWVANSTDLLTLLGRALDVILRPVAQEAWNLLAGIGGFISGIVGESIRGFMGGLPSAIHALLASSITMIIGSSALITLEAIGILSGFYGMRPSFWIVSAGNAIYETSIAWTALFCVQVRLMFQFKDTVLTLLLRIPGFEAIWRLWDRAARFVGSAIRDMVRAVPKGFEAAVHFFFGVRDRDAPVFVVICMISTLILLSAGTIVCLNYEQCTHFFFPL